MYANSTVQCAIERSVQYVHVWAFQRNIGRITFCNDTHLFQSLCSQDRKGEAHADNDGARPVTQ